MPDPIAAAPEARHVAAPGAQRQQNAMPLQHRAAMVQPASFNAEQNTVRVMWSEGVRVRRYDWWNDRVYEEELVVTPESVDMSRFEAGAVQVLDSHNGYGVRSILGIAQRGWIENGQAWADLRLSRREELAGIVQDIRDGVIRDVSAGYSVERYEITRAIDRTDGGTVDLWRAVRWTPQEISFVPVPADPAAGTRSQAQQGAQ
ncbi:MAG: peptidase, partial [Piscinibacter sp.]|nr:peptidase [Piscinibacter sp.]